MELNKSYFLLFLFFVYLLFYCSHNKYKWRILLLSSYLFCASYSLRACLVLFIVSVLNFFGGILIDDKKDNEKLQKYILYAFVAVNITVLATFKYLDFLLEHINLFLISVKSGQLNLIYLIAPLGISYYILHGIGYLVDVYWEKVKSEGHLGYFLLYMSFFPKLIMGPIERAESLLPQLRRLNSFEYDDYNIKTGVLLFVWGLCQKVVIADRLAVLVNSVYGDIVEQTGLSLIIGTLFFTFQLYYDFAGYTNMALGIGRLFNIRLSPNFNHPFFVDNIQDFWRKWHISLSFWLRDYIFTPFRMKFRRLKKIGLFFAIVATFFVAGLWHEIMWTFFAFGIVHTIYLSFSAVTGRYRNDFWKKTGQFDKKWLIFARRLITFALVCFSMIFFRAGSISDAFLLINNISHITPSYFNIFPVDIFEVEYGVALILFGELVHLLQRCGKINFLFFETPAWIRWPIYYTVVMFIFFFGEFASTQGFIYAQF